MNRRIVLAVLAIVAAVPAAAQPRGSSWSQLGAGTVAPGTDMISSKLGWPDLTLELTHGVRPNFDVGGRLQFLFGFENTTDSQFGLAFAVPLRWSQGHHGSARLLLHFDPGVRLYTTDDAMLGFQFPVGVVIEFPSSAPLRWGLGLDMNASFFFTGPNHPRFCFGPLVGPWMEYRVDSKLAFGIDSRFGAIVDAYSDPGGTEGRFGLRLQATAAYLL